MIFASTDQQWKMAEEEVSKDLNELWHNVKEGIRKSGSFSCLCQDQWSASPTEHVKVPHEDIEDVSKLKGSASPWGSTDNLIKRSKSIQSLTSFTSGGEY